MDYKEPWYTASDKTNFVRVARFYILIISLGVTLGFSLVPDHRMFVGLASAGLLMFLLYSQGVVDGASTMYIFLTDRVRGAAATMDMLNEILRRKKE